MRYLLLLLAGLALVPASALRAESAGVDHPEARPFDAKADATATVESALARAAIANRPVILVLGANWCHDSRGLAGWFAEPRFAAMLDAKYELVYVDVGHRDRNLDIARRFGVDEIKGTPTVLVLSSSGALLNRKSAPQMAQRCEPNGSGYFCLF